MSDPGDPVEGVSAWIEQEASIHLRARDPREGKPGDPVELSADEALAVARRLIELSIQLEYIDDPDLERRDWLRIPMQHLVYEAEQDDQVEHEERFAGARVECWIRDQTARNALLLSQALIEESGWLVLELEAQSRVSREDFDDEDVQFYDQAIDDGEVFLYNTFREDDD